MIPIAIKLFMGGLIKRLTAAFAWATASTAHLLIVALCVSLLGNAWLWRGWSHEQAGRKADLAAYVAAQIEAGRAQDRASAANIATQTDRNAKVNHANDIAETNRRSDLDRYIAGNRVPTQTCRAPSGASAAGLHPDSPVAVDAGPAAELVTITPADLDKLSTAALRGAESTAFLNGLVGEGLAVVVD